MDTEFNIHVHIAFPLLYNPLPDPVLFPDGHIHLATCVEVAVPDWCFITHTVLQYTLIYSISQPLT